MLTTTPPSYSPALRFAGNPKKAEGHQCGKCQCSEKPATPTQQNTEAAPKQSKANTYVQPRPKTLLMRMLGPVNRSVILKGLPLLRHIPLLNKTPVLGQGTLKLTKIDFPEKDLQELKVAVNPKTAAFIGPNHPEFFTDWMLDKEVSTRVAPEMASWADKGIVNGPGQGFWLANNLISNVSEDEGGKGKDYSIEYALKGKGVLLHPEGTVYWTGNKIHKLFSGIVDMPMRAAKMVLAGQTEQKPVFAVPLVWKLNFTKDVSKALHKEMRHIEKRLDMTGTNKQSVVDRFVTLQTTIQSRQEEKFGLPAEQRKEPVTAQNFFQRQEALQNFLLGQLEAKHGEQEGPVGKKIARLSKKVEALKATDKEAFKADMALVTELRRLQGFTPEAYDTPSLSQEDIAESLKRIRQRDLIQHRLANPKKLTLSDKMSVMIPVPVAPREAHIRVAGPAIEFTQLMKETPAENEGKLQEELLVTIQNQMQSKLDEINREIAPVVSKFSQPNPFYTGGGQAKLMTPAVQHDLPTPQVPFIAAEKPDDKQVS